MPTLLASLLNPVVTQAILAFGGMALLLVSVCRRAPTVKSVSLAALVILMLAFLSTFREPVTTALTVQFESLLLFDPFVQSAQALLLILAFIVLLASYQCLSAESLKDFEYPILFLFAVLGMVIMIAANDLLMLFLGLEIQSLALYVLIAMDKALPKASEAALKYFILGIIASLFILYGTSIIYGYTGTTSLPSLATALSALPHLPYPLLCAFLFILAGLAFKFSAAPFHMWTPDLYEGARTPVALFLASAPKVAVVLMMVRLLFNPLNHFIGNVRPGLILLAGLSMVIGSLAALIQENIKRLLAYSAVSHMGYILLGCVSEGSNAIQSVLLYIVLYSILIIGVFAFLLNLRAYGRVCETITDLRGLSKTYPAQAFIFAILLLSLAGLPPMAGFFAKLVVFMAAIHAKLYTLAVLGALTSVISAGYYLRIIKAMYFEAANADLPSIALEPTPHRATSFVLSLAVLVQAFFFLWPDILLTPLHTMAASLLATPN